MDLNYYVGETIFTDKFQAASQAWKSNQPMHFNLFESAFDHVDWHKEPTMTWDQLLDIRASQIAAKNRPIVLHFSGGTDSYTIYRVFERNKIHLAALVFNFRGDEPEYAHLYQGVHDFLRKGIYDPHCKIILDNYNYSDKFNDIYKTSEWSWTTQERWAFGIYSGSGNGDEKLCEKFGHDVISVVGTDKPRLKFTAQGVYSYQDDTPWLRHMKSNRLDSFFINPELPELHVKQSWLLKNYLQKKYCVTNQCQNFSLVNHQYDAKKFRWYEYSMACGRYGDLANSHVQHITNLSTKLSLPDSGRINDAVYTGMSSKVFDRLKGTKTMQNYISGLVDAAEDSAGKYLGMSSDNLLNIKSFYSKPYLMPY
jgi:hypothetical protein